MLITPTLTKPEDIINSRRKKWRYFFTGLVVLIAGVVGWVIVSGVIAYNSISAKNLSELPAFFRGLSPDDLSEGDTRINVLLVGADAAAGLTDSIQVLSIDPVNNVVTALSVPRDLYVDNLMGRKTKINEVYNAGVRACRNSNCDRDVDHGAEALKQVIKQALGVNIHYFARLDFRGFKTIVNSIGGVTINVEKALSDPNYPCDHDPGVACGYFQNAGTVKMNGDQALKYARCRGGGCGNDFGRSRRQQQLIAAIKDQALSVGVISNPRKLTGLLNAVGSSLRTDVKIDELQKLFHIVKDVDETKTVNVVLDNAADGPLKSGVNGNGQYILVPKAGSDNWEEVRAFVLAALPEPHIINEAAAITILHPPDKKGEAQRLATRLKKFGYNVTATEESNSGKTKVIEHSGDKPYTAALLKKRLRYEAITINRRTGDNQPDIIVHL